MPVSKPFFSARLELRDGGAHAAAFLAEGGEVGIVLRGCLGQRMVRVQQP